MWERVRGILLLSPGFSNSNINLSLSSLYHCEILKKKKSVLKILNLCIPIPTPTILFYKKEKFAARAFVMILPVCFFSLG